MLYSFFLKENSLTYGSIHPYLDLLLQSTTTCNQSKVHNLDCNLKDLPLSWWCYFIIHLFLILTLEGDYTFYILQVFHISLRVHIPSIQIAHWTLFLNLISYSPTLKLAQKTAFHSAWQLSWLGPLPQNFQLSFL